MIFTKIKQSNSSTVASGKAYSVTCGGGYFDQEIFRFNNLEEAEFFILFLRFACIDYALFEQGNLNPIKEKRHWS